MPRVSWMASRGWADPTRDPQGFRREHIVVVEPVRGVRLPVNKAIAPLVEGLVRDLEALLNREGRSLAQTRDDWGWAVRPIREGKSWSYHSWGLAIDLDATSNPMGSAKTTFPRPETEEIARKWGATWGVGWSRPDPMHFEWRLTRAQAEELVSRLAPQSGDGPCAQRNDPPAEGGAGPKPAPQPDRTDALQEVVDRMPLLKKGSLGMGVRIAQAVLSARGYRTTIDGIFGAHTEATVKRFQRTKRLAADGIIGPKTWRALLET